MGEVDIKKPKVVIIGAGMAGLAAAQRLHVSAGDFFDVIVVEAGDRIGGRILTSEFAAARIEIGATWIHGIEASPVYDIARKSGALNAGEPHLPWERMNGFPSDALTLAETGQTINPSLLRRIAALFSHLKTQIVSGEFSPNPEILSVGAFLRRGFDSYRAANGGNWIDEAVFAMHECSEREYTAVDDLHSLDLAAEREYIEFPGEHITLPGGYSRIPEFLAKSLPPGTIRLRRSVSRVEWRLGGNPPVKIHFDNGDVETADHVIVTVSLGVLKAGINGSGAGAGGLIFSPELPEAKRRAIEGLGFGLVNKVFMEMEGGMEKMKKSPFPFLRMAFDPGRHVSEIPWWIRKTDSICSIFDGSHVLLAWFVGREAGEIEEMSDGEIIRGVESTLRCFLPAGAGEFGRILGVRRSGWGRNPRFLGSYSYVAVGSSGEDQDALAEPVDGSLQILFAGEATHRTHYATTHGAYLSGVREADRLVRHYGFQSCGF